MLSGSQTKETIVRKLSIIQTLVAGAKDITKGGQLSRRRTRPRAKPERKVCDFIGTETGPSRSHPCPSSVQPGRDPGLMRYMKQRERTSEREKGPCMSSPQVQEIEKGRDFIRARSYRPTPRSCRRRDEAENRRQFIDVPFPTSWHFRTIPRTILRPQHCCWQQQTRTTLSRSMPSSPEED